MLGKKCVFSAMPSAILTFQVNPFRDDDFNPRQPRTRRRGPWGPGLSPGVLNGTRRSTYTLFDINTSFAKRPARFPERKQVCRYELGSYDTHALQRLQKVFPFRCETPGISMNSLKRPKHYWCRAKS